jgi:signal peptidase I
MTLSSQPETAERGGAVALPEPPPPSCETEVPTPVEAAPRAWPKFRITWPRFTWPKFTIGEAVIKQLKIAVTVLLSSITAYYAFSQFFITTVIVQGASMQPTMYDGDRFLLNRWAYRCRQPARGDMVVIKDPGHSDFALKRIVGLPLETIKIKGGHVYINEKELSEPYLTDGTRTLSPTLKETWFVLGRNRYFVLGDNRKVSEDSRYYGSIRKDQIMGTVQD